MYRRGTVLGAAGFGTLATLAGCSAPDGSSGDGTVTDVETIPFLARGSLPEWYPDADGLVVLVDSDEREGFLLDTDDLPDDRRATVQELLSGVDYGDERLLFVESVGPSAC